MPSHDTSTAPVVLGPTLPVHNPQVPLHGDGTRMASLPSPTSSQGDRAYPIQSSSPQPRPSHSLPPSHSHSHSHSRSTPTSRSNSSDRDHTLDAHHHLNDEKSALVASAADPASGAGQSRGRQVLDRAESKGDIGEKSDIAAAGAGPGPGPGGPGVGGSQGAGVGRPRLYSHGLFDKELKPLRAVVIKAMVGTLVILILVMWASVTAYWGSLWHSNHYTNHLSFLIINNDVSSSITPTVLSPLLGTYLTETLLANANGSLTGGSTIGTLGYRLYDGSEGTLSEEDIERMVHQQHIWGVLTIAQDATARILTARQNGDAGFDPRGLVAFYYEQARNEQAANSYVNINSGVVTGALARWSALSAAAYLSENAGNATAIGLLATAPQTIAPAASWTSYNLRPYNQPVAAALTLVGGIYSIIFTFIITMSWNGVRGIIAPYLTTRSLILARLFVPLTLYVPVSLFYSLVNLPFKVHFNAHFSSYGGGYLIFWLFIYMSMAANGLATEFFITVLTMRFVAFALLPLILVQVCVVALPEELQPRIFHYGVAAPLQRLGHAVRTIIFDTKDTLGKDAGIILAWLVCSMVTVSLATWLFRKREIKAAEKASAEKQAAA